MEENQEEANNTQETKDVDETEEETPNKGTNWVTILIVIIILSALGYFAFNQFGSGTPSPEETQQPPDMTEEIKTPPDTQMQTYTLEEVSMHDSKEDCWIVLHGMVYDVTGFDTTHPGGEAILQGCGADATGLFEERPTDGSPHSDDARDFLPNFLIGDLSE